MSSPKPPYYYKKDKKVNTYHWEISCSKIPKPLTTDWEKSNTLPYEKKDQCNECKSK